MRLRNRTVCGIERALGMPLRLPTANECRRADGPASIGTCENSGSPPPPALALSLRAVPPPPHSLFPLTRMQPHESVLLHAPSISLLHYYLPLTLHSTCSFWGES